MNIGLSPTEPTCGPGADTQGPLAELTAAFVAAGCQPDLAERIIAKVVGSSRRAWPQHEGEKTRTVCVAKETVWAWVEFAMSRLDDERLAKAYVDAGLGARHPMTAAWTAFNLSMQRTLQGVCDTLEPTLAALRAEALALHEQTVAFEELRARTHLLMGYVERENLTSADAPLQELGHIELNSSARARMEHNLASGWDNVVALLQQSGLWAPAWDHATDREMNYEEAIDFFRLIDGLLAKIPTDEVPDVIIARAILKWSAVGVDSAIVDALKPTFRWKRRS